MAGKAKTKKSSTAGRGEDYRRVAQNRRARHDYDIIETYEAGISLHGSEVKSIREGKANLREAYARIDGGEAWLVGMHVAPYANAVGFGAHDPNRPRKLLLHRKEIDQLVGRVQQQSLTLIPLSVYFLRGHAKVEIALARGRRLWDTRAAVAERDAAREVAREMAQARRGGR
ncbi:MAG: SsrA-binding protein SmpB [Acidimicrobiales bacterium]